MPAGAFAVHQLRYVLAFHGLAGAELQRQGHAYLHSLVPWMVLLIALAFGRWLHSLGRAFSGSYTFSKYALSLGALWLLCALSLIVIYASQELLEGVFATGHPAGLAGIFGSGGWWSIPAALCVGLVLAAGLHGARWVLHEVAGRRSRGMSRRRKRPSALRLPPAARLPRLAPLASGFTGRGPPH